MRKSQWLRTREKENSNKGKKKGLGRQQQLEGKKRKIYFQRGGNREREAK